LKKQSVGVWPGFNWLIAKNNGYGKKFLGVYEKLRKPTIRFAMSVSLSAWNNSAPTGWILIKFDICNLPENLS
jgi:hypothetical protein